MADTDLRALYDEIARLKTFLAPAQLARALDAGGTRMGVRAERAFDEYPIASGKPLAEHYTRQRKDGTTYRSKFKTARQQGYVMRLAKQGRIPYRRTGRLGRSITSRVDVDAASASVVVRVGSSDPKAPWVIGGPGQQSNYHAGTWPSLPQQLAVQFDDIYEAGVDGFIDAAIRLIGG